MKKIAVLAFCLISLQAAAQYDTIKVSTPDSGLGDNLRTAGHKINALIEDMNTIQIYNISQPEMAILNGGLCTVTELNYLVGVSSAIQSQLNAKAPTASPTFTGTVTLPSTTSIGSVSSTEIGYLNGLTYTPASQQDINDTMDVYKAAAKIGIRRADSASYAPGNYLPRYTAELLIQSMGVEAVSGNHLLVELQALGGSIKAIPIFCDMDASTTYTLLDQTMFVTAFYVTTSETFTGVRFSLSQAGDYTADNNNRVGLYSVSGTTATLVASTANDGTIWKDAAYAWASHAFSYPLLADPGLYYVGFLYNYSSEVQAPVMYCGEAVTLGNQSAFLGNSVRIKGTRTTQSDLPSSFDITTSSTKTDSPMIILY